MTDPKPTTLTDDEIMNVWNGCLSAVGTNKALTFARAIERRAAERERASSIATLEKHVAKARDDWEDGFRCGARACIDYLRGGSEAKP